MTKDPRHSAAHFARSLNFQFVFFFRDTKKAKLRMRSFSSFLTLYSIAGQRHFFQNQSGFYEACELCERVCRFKFVEKSRFLRARMNWRKNVWAIKLSGFLSERLEKVIIIEKIRIGQLVGKDHFLKQNLKPHFNKCHYAQFDQVSSSPLAKFPFELLNGLCTFDNCNDAATFFCGKMEFPRHSQRKIKKKHFPK